MERAPEPTMEEILASIRRIISDDESSSARQHASQGQPNEEDGLEGAEGEADDEIINDIARVLSGSGAADAQPAPSASEAAEEEEEDEILDLTTELGGLELVDEVEEIELVEVAEEAPADLFDPAPVEAAPEAEAEPELELIEEEELVLEEPVAEASEFEPTAETEALEEKAAPAPAAPRQMSASEEAASALERAIAALRAGQVPMSSSFSFEPAPTPVFTAPEPVFQPQEPAPPVEPAPSMSFASSYEPVSVPEPVSAPEPAAEAEPEPELVLTELETEEGELVVEMITSEPQVDRAWGMTAAPAWSDKGEAEEDVEMPHVNGGNSHPPYAATAEQKWLDENMTRVLTAALKDELKDNPSRLQTD
jgi:hypothetical protein